MGRTRLSPHSPCALLPACTSCCCHQPWACAFSLLLLLLGESRGAQHRLFLPLRSLSIDQFLPQVLTYVTDNFCDLLQTEFLIAVSRLRAIFPHHMGVSPFQFSSCCKWTQSQRLPRGSHHQRVFRMAINQQEKKILLQLDFRKTQSSGVHLFSCIVFWVKDCTIRFFQPYQLWSRETC